MKTDKKKNALILKTNLRIKGVLNPPDFTSPDEGADKSSKDNEADKTIKEKNPLKSKLEISPDSTGIDTRADKTKREEVVIPKKKK